MYYIQLSTGLIFAFEDKNQSLNFEMGNSLPIIGNILNQDLSIKVEDVSFSFKEGEIIAQWC